MPAIPFPPNPTRLDYTVTPWVDPYGSPWIWNQTKLRWRADVVLSDKQPLDADLTAIAALTTTAHGRSLLTSADAAASRAAIGAGTNSLPTPLSITAAPVNGEDSKVMANFTIQFSTTANIAWDDGGSSSFTNENYTYVGNNEWQVTPSERLYYSNGYWYLIQYSAVFDLTAVLQAAGGVTADPSSLTFVHAAASQGSGGAFTFTPISGTYSGTPAVPAITALSQIALATVAGVVSEWSAISMTQWREISGRMPAVIFSAAVPVDGSKTMTISGHPDYNGTLPRIGSYQGSAVYSDNAANLADPTAPIVGSKTIYRTTGGRWEIKYNKQVGAVTSVGSTMEIILPAGSVVSPELTYQWDQSVIVVTALQGSSTPTITVIGQTVIVNHTDGTFTEWGAVSLTRWLPRTPMKFKPDTGKWYREILAADGTNESSLLPNQ